MGLLVLPVLLVLAQDEIAMRPCSDYDIYAGWTRDAGLAERPSPQLAGCSQIIASGAALSSAESLALAQAIASSGAACNATVACMRQLNVIAFDGNQLSDAGATILAGALSPPAGNEPLPFEMTLSLGAANIGSLGALALAESLRRPSTTIVTLALEWNALGDEGVVALGNALAQNTALRVLGLERCGVGNAGAAALGTALRSNRAPLHELRLEGNEIGPAGATQLGGALETNTRLRSLSLALNPIGPTGAAQLARGLRRNVALESLDLAGCGIGDAGVVALAIALRGNTALRLLNLQGNGIGAEGARALASMLRINPALRLINLRLNAIGARAATALLEAARSGEAATRGAGQLETLLLEHNLVLPSLGAETAEPAGTLPPSLLAEAATMATGQASAPG